MAPIELVPAYITLLLLGGGITLLLLSSAPKVNVIECLCLAWLLGVGVVSLLLWVFGILFQGLMLQLIVTVMSLLIGFAGYTRMRRTGARWYLPTPQNWLEWMFLIFLCLQIGAIYYISSKNTLGWDGLFVWEIKARYAFLSGGALPKAYYESPAYAVSHPEYPLAIPLIQLWAYLWMAEPNQYWAKLMFPTFYAVGAGLLGLLSTRMTGQRIIGLMIPLLLFFIPQVIAQPGGATSGYADFPLAITYLVCIGYGSCWLIGRSAHSFSIFATSLALLPWIKKEGVILWVIGVLIGILVVLVRREKLWWLLAFLPGVVLVAGWNIFLQMMNVTQSTDFLPVTMATARENIGRLVPIYHAVFLKVTTMNDWGIFWLLAGLACVYLVWRGPGRLCLILFGAFLLPASVYTFIYVFSAWPQYIHHVTSSIARLLMQVVPVLLLFIAVAIAECLPGQARVTPLTTRWKRRASVDSAAT